MQIFLELPTILVVARLCLLFLTRPIERSTKDLIPAGHSCWGDLAADLPH